MKLAAVVRDRDIISLPLPAGYVMDRYPSSHYWLMFGYTTMLGVTAGLFPFMGSVYALFCVVFIMGFNSGSLDTGKQLIFTNLRIDGISHVFIIRGRRKWLIVKVKTLQPVATRGPFGLLLMDCKKCNLRLQRAKFKSNYGVRPTICPLGSRYLTSP